MAINRTGYMTIGGGLPLSNVTLNVMNSRQTGFRVSSNSTTLNGIVNELTSSSTSSDIFGIQNVVLASSSTSNYLYGTYNEMGGTSSAEIYASYGLSSNSGAGASVGNVALAYNYGATEGITVGGLGFAFDQQSGSSTDRITYGLWGLGNSNNSTGTSVIYGVYGSVSGSYDVGYAGYFGGDVYTTGSYLPSDVTLKSNITPVSSSLDRIMALNVYSYNYMTSAYPRMNLPEGTQFGFLAQEMQQLFPELTKTAVQPGMSELEIRQMQKSGQEVPENASESKTFTAVNYAGLVPHLTKAIQEQQVMIQQLEDQLAEKESLLGLDGGQLLAAHIGAAARHHHGGIPAQQRQCTAKGMQTLPLLFELLYGVAGIFLPARASGRAGGRQFYPGRGPPFGRTGRVRGQGSGHGGLGQAHAGPLTALRPLQAVYQLRQILRGAGIAGDPDI
jgi:hypothetical protein